MKCQYAKRAAYLMKADLTTQMVTEMTSLQGIIGREYAVRSGENAEVALPSANNINLCQNQRLALQLRWLTELIRWLVSLLRISSNRCERSIWLAPRRDWCCSTVD